MSRLLMSFDLRYYLHYDCAATMSGECNTTTTVLSILLYSICMLPIPIFVSRQSCVHYTISMYGSYVRSVAITKHRFRSACSRTLSLRFVFLPFHLLQVRFRLVAGDLTKIFIVQ